MDIIQSFIQELQQETQATRKLFSVIPDDKLTWKPHEKSMTLGQLAIHIASLPARISQIASGDSIDARNARFQPPQPESREEIVKTLESSIHDAAETLQQWDSSKASGVWRFTNGEKEIFAMPRSAVIRTILLNHLYHHRGQLTVYLRLLDVLLPITYGRSADTSPLD